MGREAIFIGYRRDDTADVAGRIYDALAGRFGKNRIFKDVDNLRPGADFGAYIQGLLPRCRVVLVLIGPNWIEAKDESGRRRLDDPHDWVRIEIETALDTPGLDVVPVLVNGARIPRADELPPSLHPLLRRHAAIIRRDPDFHDDVGRLTTALRASVSTGVLDLKSLGGERKAAAAGANKTSPALAIALGVLVLAGMGYGVWRFLPSPEAAETAGVSEPEGPLGPPASSRQQEGRQDAGAPSGACADCPEMVTIPAGTFTMGSPASEEHWDGYDGREAPQHHVNIRAFAASKYEITFAQWDACVAGGGCGGYRPADQGWGRGARPVANVSWNDAQSYITWINGRVGGQRYRLLSEAEWEYAARAGTSTAYPWGASASHERANYGADACCSGLASETDRWVNASPVGSFAPNDFGLYDMHGNVWEWTQDCWNANYNGAPANGAAWTAGDCAIRGGRGGSWIGHPTGLRSANRSGASPTDRLNYVGFRLARTS
jgi:formylglycine-generating enzyme required for sulfatase activity